MVLPMEPPLGIPQTLERVVSIRTSCWMENVIDRSFQRYTLGIGNFSALAAQQLAVVFVPLLPADKQTDSGNSRRRIHQLGLHRCIYPFFQFVFVATGRSHRAFLLRIPGLPCFVAVFRRMVVFNFVFSLVRCRVKDQIE